MSFSLRSCMLIAALSVATSPFAHAVSYPERTVVAGPGQRVQLEGQTWHPVRVDPQALRAVAKSGSVALPSTGDKPLPVQFQGLVERSDGFAIWTGKVQTSSGEQSVVLTLGKGMVFGLIPQVDGPPLRLETRHDTVWLVEGETRFRAPAGDDFTLPSPPTAAERELRARQDEQKALGDPRVDVLVLYAPALVTVWGSVDAVHARIAQLEAITRQSYVDSGAAIDIRVVARHLVDYTTKNTNGEALAEMRGDPESRLFQEAARLRSLYGADLVVLMRDFERGLHDSCGNGYILGYHGSAFTADRGFSVVADHGYGGDNCNDWTFAHELGHNMGAHHDTETTEGDYGAYPYSRGHRATTGSDRGFATIMAYNTMEQWRLGLFSSPLLNQCLGQACGVADSADNVRGLSNAAAAMAGLVPSVPAGSSPVVSISDASVIEGASGGATARFSITLSAPASAPVQLSLGTTNGSAVAGSDYVAVSSASRTIPAGQTRVDFDVTVNGDTEVEANEVFALTLQSVSGAFVADGQGVATIVNDEAIPTLSVDDVARPEGQSGVGLVPVTIRLSAPSPTPVGFSLRAHDYAPGPTAAVVGEDFVDTNLGNLSIPAGLTSETVFVASRGDTTVEQDESLYVVVGNVTGALVGDAFAVVTLRDDDGPDTTTPRLSISDADTIEGGVATFTLRLSAPSASAVTADLATAERAATPGVDFTARTTTLSIPAGQTSAAITVQTLADSAVEPDESFWLLMSNVSGAVVEDFRGVGWIRDNDSPGTDPGPGADMEFRLRDDRIVVLNSQAAPTTVAVLANDVFDPARLAGGSLSIVSSPVGVTATISNNNTPAQLEDDTLVYTASAERSDIELIRYRLCEGGTGGRCAEAYLRVQVRPVLDLWVESETGSGFTDIVVPRERPSPADTAFTPKVSVSALAVPERINQVINADPTPSTPWDQSLAGTTVIMRTLTAQPGENTLDWRVLVDARMPGGDVDVYMGVDTDQDNTPESGELRCVAAMSAVAERCEIVAQTPFEPGALRYWVMLHNRSSIGGAASAEVFVVPVPVFPYTPVASALVATAPGVVQAQDPHAVRLAWTDLALLPGESRLAYVQLEGRFSTGGVFPVRIDRTDDESPAVSLVSGVATALRLAPGAAQDRMYIDIPVGASELVVTTSSGENIDVYLSRPATPSSPQIAPAPARSAAVASAVGAGGNETLGVSGGALLPGRWYVTPVNAGTAAASVELRATVTGATLPTRAGSYFNASRGGHGLFVYPAADQWTGLWYTYLQDGTPTWYYLQGPKPGGNGLWNGTLYRSAWDGDSNALTVIGRGQIAPSGPDAFTFSYTLDGETGSEPLTALGRGCPTLSGQPLDVSSTWFNPARAGAGYSVQMYEDYEFYAAFIYDRSGTARFVLAESPDFAGADATLALEQLSGFCPLCARSGNPARQSIGTLARRFSGGSFANIAVDGIFTGPVTGVWTADEAIQPLGGPGTVQGCLP